MAEHSEVEPLTDGARATLWFGLVAVGLYVGGWLVAGMLRAGYDPSQQAISELFELGAPVVSRSLMVAGLLLSGLAFLLLAPVLHRTLPGGGRLGPLLHVVAQRPLRRGGRLRVGLHARPEMPEELAEVPRERLVLLPAHDARQCPPPTSCVRSLVVILTSGVRPALASRMISRMRSGVTNS